MSWQLFLLIAVVGTLSLAITHLPPKQSGTNKDGHVRVNLVICTGGTQPGMSKEIIIIQMRKYIWPPTLDTLYYGYILPFLSKGNTYYWRMVGVQFDIGLFMHLSIDCWPSMFVFDAWRCTDRCHTCSRGSRQYCKVCSPCQPGCCCCSRRQAGRPPVHLGWGTGWRSSPAKCYNY